MKGSILTPFYFMGILGKLLRKNNELKVLDRVQFTEDGKTKVLTVGKIIRYWPVTAKNISESRVIDSVGWDKKSNNGNDFGIVFKDLMKSLGDGIEIKDLDPRPFNNQFRKYFDIEKIKIEDDDGIE